MGRVMSSKLDSFTRRGYVPTMKIWIKFLLAGILGVVAGSIIPISDGAISVIFSITIGLSLILLYPLEFFGAAIGIYELHEEKKLLKTLAQAALYALAFLVAATLLGIIISFFAPSIRIQLGEKIGTVQNLPTIGTILEQFFPSSIFSIFGLPTFILPLFVAAVFVGLSFSSNRHAGKIMLNFFESASELLWNINSFLIEIFPLLFIVVSAAVTRSLINIRDFSNYAKLFNIIGIESLIYIGGILPLAIYIRRKKKNPYKILYAMIASALSALFIPHAFASAANGLKHLKESLGIRRRVNATTLPLALTFGRAGTVLIGTTAFIVVLSSYSQIGLTVQSILWVLVWLPIAGLLAGAGANLGVLSAIAFVCSIYGRGFESGFVLLLPVALPLFLIANCMDTLTSMTIVYCTSYGEDEAIEHEMRHFI